jgi:hypothetical protein
MVLWLSEMQKTFGLWDTKWPNDLGLTCTSQDADREA